MKRAADKSPLRVLHVITQSRVAGAEINMVRLCRGLLDRGHEVLVAVRPGSALRGRLATAAVPFRQIAMHGKGNVLAPFRLAALIREWQPALVNTHNSTAGMWGCLAARACRTPAVAHVQGIHYSCTLWSCYGAADRLIACSGAVRRHTLAVGFAGPRVDRVYNAVEANDFLPSRPRDEVRGEVGLAPDELALGAFGHLSHKKGHADLLEAIARLPGDVPRFRLFIAGEGRLRGTLERQAAGLGLADRVHFLGYRHDVADLMHAMDLMALPSHCEPFGIVYVEAMLARLPVVACAAGGALEVVLDGETGLLVPPRAPAELAKALRVLLSSPALRHRFGEAGRQRAATHFTLDRMVDETEAVYRAALRRTSPARSQADPPQWH